MKSIKNHNGGQPEFINSQQASKFLLVTPRTLANYRKRGYVKYSIICGKTYYSKNDIMELLRNGITKNREDSSSGSSA